MRAEQEVEPNAALPNRAKDGGALRIPEFPRFVPIDFAYREEVERFTATRPHHGDYNFTSLWAWDCATPDSTGGGLAWLNGNLVLRLDNVLAGQLFYSFSGLRHVGETAATLLRAAADEGLRPELRLIGAEEAAALAALGFAVTADQDHFDYILDVAALAAMAGGAWAAKRKAANRFARRHAHAIRRLDLTDPGIVRALLALRETRPAARMAPAGEPLWSNPEDADWPALERVLGAAGRFDFLPLGVEVGGEIVAFYVTELIRRDPVVAHFIKADHVTFPGAPEAAWRAMAQALTATGFTSLNSGSDDGIAGLRENKLLYRPINFVRKYSISLANPVHSATSVIAGAAKQSSAEYAQTAGWPRRCAPREGGDDGRAGRTRPGP